jgi:hypothetical protein
MFFQDSAYFLGSTVTTIGFGDILPEVRFLPLRNGLGEIDTHS